MKQWNTFHLKAIYWEQSELHFFFSLNTIQMQKVDTNSAEIQSYEL